MKLIYIIFFFFFSNFIYAQKKQYEFIGLLELDNKVFIPYQIKFSINPDATVTGESVSDIMGVDETKSQIVGHFDKDSKTIQLKETQLIYTKSAFDPGIFCNLEFEIPIKKQESKSKFIGKYPDGSHCVEGKLHLKDVEKMNVLYKALLTKVDKLEQKQKINTEEADAVKDALTVAKIEPVKLFADEKLNYLCKDKAFTLQLWDEAKDDGDEIAVYFNGEMVKQLAVTLDKQSLQLNLKKGKNTVSIKAINHGELAPNTVSFELQNGKNNVEVHNILETNQTSYIHLFLE